MGVAITVLNFVTYGEETGSKDRALKAEALNKEIERQLEYFRQGTQYVKLLRPATVNGGIFRLSDTERNEAVKRFTNEVLELRVMKFVPASGAATRMFKRVRMWIDDPKEYSKEINAFFRKAESLAFFDRWMKVADKADVETFESGLESKVKWLRLLCDPEGLSLEQMPKALIPFHLYRRPQTPLAEHMKEAMAYSSSGGVARLHFTISPEHERAFRKEVNRLIKTEPFCDFEWEIGFSYQSPSTDTIALDAAGNALLIRGEPSRRPGGHGALIHNLNGLDADLVFIKNIDNVCHERMLDTTVEYKKVLAGMLLKLRKDLAGLHADLEHGLVDEMSIIELRDRWNIRIPKGYQKLKKYLERPVRVCGMVRNQGEPGGGPFWTTDDFTGESLQIVEQVQVDPKNSRQMNLLQSSTHFNPVDIVCYLKNFRGEKIDLYDYVNHNLYFIAEKRHKGHNIKALEWPGLWNGAMADWITIFVEVPADTFNPVKELGDLLRHAHLRT